ncbi:MAG: succinylglutamate desuccinylase/aspartoacylase family protein [Flammeovirgaceae bacterium]
MSSETSKRQITILGHEIERGKEQVIEMEVAKLHNGNNLKIPVIINSALEDGPTLLLMGGVHGDEINGVAIVRDIIRQGYNKPKKGTIICIPVFNAFGYLNLKREFPDGRDLNRVFPGSSKGSLASQFAYKFTHEIAPFVDYVLDFHTGGAERSNYPNIRCVLNDEEQMKLAKIFGAPFIVHSSYIPKSIRYTLNKMGKTILLFEGGKSFELDDEVIAAGVAGSLNLMRYLGLQNGSLIHNYETVVINKSKWIRAPYSGMFQYKVKNGTRVPKKTLLGIITDPYGEFCKSVFAPFDCYVFGVNTSPIVHKGDALFHVGE